MLCHVSTSYQYIISLIHTEWNIAKYAIIILSNWSCDALAPNINLFGLRFPQGVLNVAIGLESGCNDNWWNPLFKSNLENVIQSLNLYM